MSELVPARVTVDGVGDVSACWCCAPAARWVLVLAHGAGAGMRHPFMDALADALASADVATFRYQFPYMEARRRRPDPPEVLTATVRAAVCAAGRGEGLPDALRAGVASLPLIAGGKSMGGRMTSRAAAGDGGAHGEGGLPGARAIVFFGFPLHPPGQRGVTRAAHLERVALPMLFLQGTRDDFADLTLLRPICDRLAPRASLHTVEGADHSFHVLKRSGRTDGDVMRELVETLVHWLPGRAGEAAGPALPRAGA